MFMTKQLKKIIHKALNFHTRKFDIYVAKTPEEFEEIHRFNYKVFVKELGQYEDDGSGRKVDANHERNTYFAAKCKGRMIGMVCMSRPGPEGFSVQKKMKNPEKIDQYREKGAEIRLLAIEKEYRGLGLMWKLGLLVGKHFVESNYEYGFISGIKHRVGMYERFGFQVIDEPCKVGAVEFVPMMVTRDQFLKAAQFLDVD